MKFSIQVLCIGMALAIHAVASESHFSVWMTRRFCASAQPAFTRDLLVDFGICSYDQREPHELRKTAAQNVVIVDGQEQPKADPKVLAWQTAPEADFAAAELTGTNWVHQRSVLFVKPHYWVVMDYVLGKGGEHEVARFFHFLPESKARAEGGQVQTTFAEGMNLRVVPMDAPVVEMREATFLTGQAAFANARVAVFTVKGALPLVACTVLLPYDDPLGLPTVTKIPASHPLVRKIAVQFPNGQRDEIAFAPEVRPLHLSGKEGYGRALLLRKGSMAQATVELGAAAMGGTSVQSGGSLAQGKARPPFRWPEDSATGRAFLQREKPDLRGR